MNTSTAYHNEEDSAPLDLRRLADLRALRNGSLLAQLVKGYTEQGQREVAAIHAAAQERRFQEGAGFAHSLKSSSLNIGAQLVGGISRRIETEMLAGNSAQLETLCQELEDSFAQTVEYLRELP